MFKKLLKFCFYFFLSILLLGGAGIGAAYLLKDNIIRLFVDEANKSLNAKVYAEKITLDFIQTFPQFSIDFKNVEIIEAVPGSKDYCAKAENVFFSFSFWDLWNKKYKIRNLFVKNADLRFVINKDGSTNFDIFKPSRDTAKSNIIFKLSGVKLDDVNIDFTDNKINNHYSAFFKQARANFKFINNDWRISLKGNLQTRTVKIDKWEFFKNKPIAIESEIIYSQKDNLYTVNHSKINVLNAYFKLEGQYKDDESKFINFTFSEENSDFQTVISFLPPKLSEPLHVYKSKGNIYFKGSVKGSLARNQKPLVKVYFGCKDASFFHPDIKEGIAKASFTGEFRSKAGPAPSLLNIKNIKAQLNGREITGNFSLVDFADPYIELDAKSSVDAGYFFKVFPNDEVEKASGDFDFNIIFKGKTSDFKNKNYSSLYTNGEINLKDLDLKFRSKPIAFTKCNGNFLFNKNDLSASNFSCKMGRHSDLYFHGILNNVIPFILYKNESLSIDADIRSDNLDLDELLKSKEAIRDEAPYTFAFFPKVTFDFRAKIDKLSFQKFKSSNLEGNFTFNNHILSTKGLKMEMGRGKVALEGALKELKDSVYEARLDFRIDKIEIDSIFWITNEFGQDFITHKNLKGQLNADVRTIFVFDKHLKIESRSFYADINAIIKNGRLVNFKPMKNLARFVNEEALEDIKFSELKNSIHIAGQTVYIPEMNIRSNIANISAIGTHNFDNRFEYKLKIPIKNYKRKNTEEEENAIEGNSFSGFYLYLVIKGTPDNFKISYDKSAVKQKIKERWKEEKQEFKELFKKDYQKNQQEKEKVKELNEDEYFDF